MHVLFVNYSFDRRFHAGIAALSSFIKRAGHSTSLIIYDAKMSEEDFKERIRVAKPDLVAFTVMTYQWNPVKHLLPLVKEVTDVPVICGGYHPTLYPEDVISHPDVDVVCQGEGEDPLLDYLEAYESGKDAKRIPNLLVKEQRNGNGATIHRNPIRRLRENLDEYPSWDREIFDYDSMLNQRGAGTLSHTRFTMAVGAGRGCPDQCTYCSAPALNRFYRAKGRFIRKRSPEHVVAEMKELVDRYPIKFFEFWDERIDIFPSWLFKFCELYGKEIGLPWSADMRVERATMDILSAMAKSGCYMVWFGVENGNEEYRKRYLKRYMSNQQILDAFKNCRDLGIETLSLNMLGLPYESPEQARETIELNRAMRPDTVLFFTYQAFPGTELGELAVREGFAPMESVYWYERPETCLVQESMSKEEMQRLWQEWRELQMELEAERRARGSIVFEIDSD